MSQNRKFFRLPLIALLAGLGVAQAGDVVIYREGETPDPSDIARILRGGAGARSDSDDGGSAPVRTRGIKLLSEDTQPRVAPARIEIRQVVEIRMTVCSSPIIHRLTGQPSPSEDETFEGGSA